MWRGGRCLQGRDWQECIFSRWGAPWQSGSQRWGEVRALAPQCASSSEQGGGPIQHESHRNLQRSSWQTDHGEDPDSEFQRASFDEQEERDGWSEGGQDEISEVGRWLSWVAPATKPTQNPTGYPGDLKFPGRCDCYLLQFKPRSGTWQFIQYFVCYQGGGPHAWQWPGKEAGEEVENPAGGAHGGWRCRGGRGTN